MIPLISQWLFYIISYLSIEMCNGIWKKTIGICNGIWKKGVKHCKCISLQWLLNRIWSKIDIKSLKLIPYFPDTTKRFAIENLSQKTWKFDQNFDQKSQGRTWNLTKKSEKRAFSGKKRVVFGVWGPKWSKRSDLGWTWRVNLSFLDALKAFK